METSTSLYGIFIAIDWGKENSSVRNFPMFPKAKCLNITDLAQSSRV